MPRLMTANVLAGLGAIEAIVMVTAAGLAQPLKIGMTLSLSGVGASSGQFQLNGAKLAVNEVNGSNKVLGRALTLVIEDDQTTNPGIVLAFSKLAGDPEIPAFLGEIRSTQTHAMAPDVL